MLAGPKYRAPRSIVEFDHKLGLARNSLVIKNPVQWTSVLRWVEGHIVEQDSQPAWVTTHTEPIVKASINFPAKVWWAIVRSHIRLTLVDHILMLESAVLVANVFASYDIDWARLVAE